MAKSKVEYWLTHDGLTLLAGWARDGLTDEQIAHNCGISRKTLSEWKTKYSNIGSTLKKNKEVVDFEVENVLLKRALGYTVEIKEEKIDRYGDKHTLKKDVYVPGDVTAMIFWLKNRQPAKWRDKQIEPIKDNEGVIIVNDLPKQSIEEKNSKN